MDDQQQIKALQHDAQRFGELVRICPNGIAVCAGDRIACVNPALSRLVDRPADELAGTRFADLLFEAGRDRTCTRLAAMLAENAGHDTSAVPDCSAATASRLMSRPPWTDSKPATGPTQ